MATCACPVAHVQATTTTVQDIFESRWDSDLGSFIVPDLYTEAQLISLWNAMVALFAVVPGEERRPSMRPNTKWPSALS